ncbi:ankyrin repeat domain-containing protein 13C isoform X1 [Drosophila kikkawai]|uniref:Ankyrin repeat domain-containing protein 13C isoform X1 n=1 Tax=Drosophila kikkawai TaxID=30033 RepID=A0A6P4JCU4_DROKI|nr:ankyrin repeat domain-containing protein 13C [Drosophila kikkawai]
MSNEKEDECDKHKQQAEAEAKSTSSDDSDEYQSAGEGEDGEGVDGDPPAERPPTHAHLCAAATTPAAASDSTTTTTTTPTAAAAAAAPPLVTVNEPLDYPMHQSVFEDDIKSLQRRLLMSTAQDEVGRKDKHGNTPLHLAVMLGRKHAVRLLLAHNAPVKIKNNEGWSPLSEAISYGDRQTITQVLRMLKLQSREHMEGRREKLVNALRQIQDFYMEFKWDFQSWLPLVSRILPSDICRLYKSGASIRLDTTLVDFNDMRWERGDISFLFRGEAPPRDSLVLLDNEQECFQRLRYEEADMEDEVDVLMSTDILATQMSTKTIQFARAQRGWIFRANRKELIGGQYQCEIYTIQGLILKQRKRREHLSHEDLQKNRAIVETITKGGPSANHQPDGRRSSLNSQHTATPPETNTPTAPNGITLPELPRRSSLQAPPATTVTWQQYLDAEVGKCPQLGRPPVHKQSNKTLRATVAMSKDFPLSVDMLLDVLEVVAPLKHINKLREFVTLKLPTGFPVKIEIPVLHTVTAKVTFQKFEFRDNIPAKMFQIPSHYWEDVRRFQDL